MEKKVSFGRDGIIAMRNSKSYMPVGFIRKDGSEFVGYIFSIKAGFAEYSNRTNNIYHAMATGTIVSSESRKDIANKVAEIYAASFQ
jgi:hypothetical protein